MLQPLQKIHWNGVKNWILIISKIPARMHKEDPALVNEILKVKKEIFISVRPDEVNSIKIKMQKNYIFLMCISNYPTLYLM